MVVICSGVLCADIPRMQRNRALRLVLSFQGAHRFPRTVRVRRDHIPHVLGRREWTMLATPFHD
jgi:hypothetical protein